MEIRLETPRFNAEVAKQVHEYVTNGGKFGEIKWGYWFICSRDEDYRLVLNQYRVIANHAAFARDKAKVGN